MSLVAACAWLLVRMVPDHEEHVRGGGECEAHGTGAHAQHEHARVGVGSEGLLITTREAGGGQHDTREKDDEPRRCG